MITVTDLIKFIAKVIIVWRKNVNSFFYLLKNIHILAQLVRGRKRSVNLMAEADSKLRRGGR